MALLMCKLCKKAFISDLQEDEICLDCDVRLRRIYPIVRSFLRDNEREAYTAKDVSKIMDIAQQDVEALISMGLLSYKTKHKHTNTGKK